MKLLKTVAKSLLAATFLGLTLSIAPMSAIAANAVQQQQYGTVKGTVFDENGEPVFGAVVFVVGTQNSTSVDFDGNFELANVKTGSSIRVMLMGYTCDDQVWNGKDLKFIMAEESTALDEVVVTAMGIMRKEKSLTYATQLIKADDLLKTPDVNLINSLDGKVSGITITPSAGGAGGASKITLRGNKSILGNNAPLIVVDGVPLTNNVREQVDDAAKLAKYSATEGSDPLSMINPDDIESMNVLKGANAAALYGSRAANGVIMITTKKGKEGKMDISFTSNTTFDMPLLTPELQNTYGGFRSSTNILQHDSWGDRLDSRSGSYIHQYQGDGQHFRSDTTLQAHIRNKAKNDIKEFFDTGINATNSISVSGGTEKIQTYVSYSNTQSIGMIASNKYTRNTFAFRQSYKLWDRITLNASINYNQAKTKNRVGGGLIGNPIYHLYMAPRDVDMDYYKKSYKGEGQWWSHNDKDATYYVSMGNGRYMEKKDHGVILSGPMQQYAFQSPMINNPYWLTNMNQSEADEDRLSASFHGTLRIIDGLNLQGRVSIEHTRYHSESQRYATTWYDTDMYRYGSYYLNDSRTNEIYTDYMLSYNKVFAKDWSVSASVGYVGHTNKGLGTNTGHFDATTDMSEGGYMKGISTDINMFDPSYGKEKTTKWKSSDWDQAVLGTAQFGWKDIVFIDGSYRHDWYRPFRQFEHLGTKASYGYFGVGANAILSELFKMPKWFNYAKYRISYSEVGNSIPNVRYFEGNLNSSTGAAMGSSYNRFIPEPEKTKSFETGLEMQFFRECLNLDITYYNSAMHNSYLLITATNGNPQPVNSGIIRNQGVEVTIGYDWKISRNWRWKTNLNFSYNHNRIEATSFDKYGNSKDMAADPINSKIQLKYKKGGSYGDIYITDFTRYLEDTYMAYRKEVAVDETGNPILDENGNETFRDVPFYNTTGEGTLVNKAGDIYIDETGRPTFGGEMTVDAQGMLRIRNSNKKYQTKVGNVNSPYQLSWSNTFTYKDFTLYFLINGRIGGKVISFTEGYLDQYGQSKRSGEARQYAEKNNIYTADGRHGMYLNGKRNLVAVEDYYTQVGSSYAGDYIYDATNFRLRELSLGYTFRNLFGEYKNLSLSFVCRNLFFIYKSAPVDPDVSLSTANGFGGIDIFNFPSPRSFGLNIKLNL